MGYSLNRENLMGSSCISSRWIYFLNLDLSSNPCILKICLLDSYPDKKKQFLFFKLGFSCCGDVFCLDLLLFDFYLGYFYDSYKSPSNLPEARALVWWIHRFCEKMLSEKSWTKSYSNPAATGQYLSYWGKAYFMFGLFFPPFFPSNPKCCKNL